jgi:hypothetical protein
LIVFFIKVFGFSVWLLMSRRAFRMINFPVRQTQFEFTTHELGTIVTHNSRWYSITRKMFLQNSYHFWELVIVGR